jgi:hypothetical protein
MFPPPLKRSKKMAIKKWRDDKRFVEWLLTMKYIQKEKGKLKSVLSDGLYLYMYEAYSQGKNPPMTVSKMNPYDHPLEFASFQGVF